MKTQTIRLAIALGSLAIALPASAADIRDQLTPDLIYNHCKTAGVGSQVEGMFMLPTGRVTGSLLCTDADVAASNMVPAYRGDDDDDDHHRGGDNQDGHDDDREDRDDD